MLISQKIAANPKFLKPAWGFSRNPDDTLKLRQEIIRSVKFLMGTHLFNGESARESDIFKRNYSDKPDSKIVKTISSALHRLSTFARVPYPTISIENKTGLLLIRDEGDRISMVSVLNTGAVMYAIPYVMKDAVLDLKKVDDALFPPEVLSVVSEENVKNMSDLVATSFYLGMELLVYLNVVNIKHVPYKPSRRESVGITPMYVPFYEYKIIDLFRERTAYESLADVESFINDRRNEDTRRAHMVIGHFKEIGRALFWWNCHMRSKRNQESRGVIVKDYAVH